MRRVIIFGIDGLAHGMWQKLAASGVMPNSVELLKTGTLVPMQSAIPDVSSVAWTSIVTGQNPGTHNVYGFTDILDGTYTLMFTNSRTSRAKPFWRYDSAGKSLIMNVPQTYPAQPLDGVLIAGYVALDLVKSVYPQELLSVFEKAQYQIDIDMEMAHQSRERFHQALVGILQTRAEMLEDLWQREQWQSLMFVITGTDRLNHYFWHEYEDPGAPGHQLFLEFYHEVDRVLGRVMDKLDEDDAFVVVSDHGFEAQDVSVNLNYLLRQHGFLHLSEDERVTPASMLPETRAFAMDPGRIYLHREGRYPNGKVTDGEAEGIIEELMSIFTDARVQGKPLVRAIMNGADTFSGPMAYRAPDLVLMGGQNIAFSSRLQCEKLVEETRITGKHTFPDAVFFYRGPEAQIPAPMSVEKILSIFQQNGLLTE